jgi:rhodanese-related sulfurtransferase
MIGWFALSIVLLGVLWFILPRVNWISPKRASELLEAGAHLIDVRSDNEFTMMHLFESQNVPINLLEEAVREAGFKKKDRILVFCQSGMRSAIAVKLLKKMGFRYSYNLGTYNRARKAVALKNSVSDKD